MSKWYNKKRATTVCEVEGMQACIYHQTAVVSWDDTRVILRSGGWETRTTKTRMNEVAHEYGLGYFVWSTKGEWWVELPPQLVSYEEEQLRLLARTDIGDGVVMEYPRQTVPFVDGMEFQR